MAQWTLLIVFFCVATAAAGLSFHDSNPIRMVSDMEKQLLQVIGESRHAVSFARFANRYGKRYDTVDEMKRRFKIFSENLQLIKSTNKKRLGYTLGVNHFADWTWEEFRSHRLGAAQNCSATLKGNHRITDVVLPAEKDWRKEGIVSEVKDQGHCGSCWTFSTTGALESAYAQAFGKNISLSEQQLVDCAGAFTKMEKQNKQQWRPDPETPRDPMEFLSRSWSASAMEVSKALSPAQLPPLSNKLNNASSNAAILEDFAGEVDESIITVSGNPFSFASSQTSQMVLDRIMSHSQEVSPRTSGRLSHSSGPLNGSLTDSPPVSPSEMDDFKYNRSSNNHNNNSIINSLNNHYRVSATGGGGGGGKTVGRWLKERKEKKKEETRAHNAQLHAAVSVAGVAAAVAAIAAATAASSGARKDEQMAKTDMAVASAATLVAAQCVEAAEAMGAERDHLASVVSSAVNVRSAGDIQTLTAAAATALRGAATLKARALKEVWNIAAVIPVEKNLVGNGNGNGNGGGGSGSNGSSNSSFSGELAPEENFLGICSRELLARGCELLKRTRTGELHWKIVSVYINRMNQVMLKMKSRHVAGTITKKKKNVVIGVIKEMPAWPGRHLLEGGDNRRYFGLKTITRGVVEFECRNQREYDVWTQGVSRLISIAAERNNKNRTC